MENVEELLKLGYVINIYAYITVLVLFIFMSILQHRKYTVYVKVAKSAIDKVMKNIPISERYLGIVSLAFPFATVLHTVIIILNLLRAGGSLIIYTHNTIVKLSLKYDIDISEEYTAPKNIL